MRLPWKRLIGVSVLLFNSSQGQTTAQEPRFEPDSKSVQVFLTAVDKHDLPITPLQSELSVSIDKNPAQIGTLLAAGADSLLFAVVVDISGSDTGTASAIKQAAIALFEGLLTSGNRGYLVLFNASVKASDQPLQISQAQHALSTARFGGGTAVYDAIAQTCTQKLSRSGNPQNPRRVLVLISDGEDNLSHVTPTAAEETAEKEGVAVFSLMTHSEAFSGVIHPPRGERFMKELSHETGGRLIEVSDPTKGVMPLIKSVEGQWALSLTPAHSLNRKLHSLDIKTSQKGLNISAPAHVFVQ